MIKLTSFFVFCLTFACGVSQLLVTLPNGKIQGNTQKSATGRQYLNFQGIPFAKPPLKELRFKAPEPPTNWDGVKETIAYSNSCFNMDTDFDTENEDCLYLNVYTPVLNATANKTKLPVIISTYGGGFRNGMAGFNPRYWIDNDIVVVSYNYRIGAFGFLSTGDLVLPGNAGLKDQLLALQWVYNNIHLFGGDNKKITIQGQSAGGASVGYLFLNPKAKNLFRAGIAESGSPLNTWTYNYQPFNYTVQLAQQTNNSISPKMTSAEYLKYLQSLPARTIDKAAAALDVRPVAFVEPEHDGAVLTQPMYEAFEQGKYYQVPLILGVNSEERITIISDLNSVKAKAAKMDSNPARALPDSYTLKSGLNTKTVGKVIRDLYAGEANEKLADHLGKYVKWESDNRFTRGVIKQGQLMSNHSPVYFYQFSYKGQLATFNQTIAEADTVAHGEENAYFSTRSKTNENDALTHDRVLTMWVNFVKTLNPTPSKLALLENHIWPKVSPTDFKYLNINASLSIDTQPKGEYFVGWQNLFEQYMQRPFTTY